MKIAYLLGSLNRGGTETLLLDVFKHARENNLDAVGMYRKSGMLESDFLQSGIKMHKFMQTGNLIRNLCHLRKLCKSQNIEIIHAQQPIDALYAWIAVFGTQIKIVLTHHGFDFNEKGISKIILYFIISRTDKNIYVSNYQKDYYLNEYKLKKEKQVLVYNGVSFDKIDQLSITVDTTLREELNIAKDKLLMGSVGNFVPGRDQLSLCFFLKKLKDEAFDFYFVFVGKQVESAPHLFSECYNYCEKNNLLKNVFFLGSRSDVPAIVKQLDAFIYASDHDSFGIAVVEAMAMGIPVFVNDWNVMTEITQNGKYAILYKTKNVNDLIIQFNLYIQNKSIYYKHAKLAAMFVRTQYSISNHISELIKVYNSIS